MTLDEIALLLKNKNWDAYIVPHNNTFIGQDILPEENKIMELCGFSGSAGTLLIMQNKTFLLVDGRYNIQAQKETSASSVEVVCTSESIGSWLQQNIKYPLTIAYNPWHHSISEVDFWHRTLIRHNFVEDNEQILGSSLSSKEADIFEHRIEFSGISSDEKLSYLTQYIQENHLDAFLLCEPDSVSWLLNLRSDILPYTPIFRAFALIDKDGNTSLYQQDFNKLEDELSALKNKIIGLSPNHTPQKINSIIKQCKILKSNHHNPVEKWKSIKNPIEIDGFKKSHIRDGVALCKFLYWLDNNWQNQTELSVVEKLYELRSQEQNFYKNSFATIAGFGSNGAIVHYQPNEQTNLSLSGGNILLLDSGAQYFDGTTDVTRTIAIGNVTSQKIKDSFTQVLKAHIAAANTIFPPQTSGSIIDGIARSQLWQFGKDYAHGTGHGVGHFLNVHEGPFSLSQRRNNIALEVGQITSIEPGYYVEDEYGIRIENLYYISAMNNPEYPKPMLCFVPLTLVPIDKRLINKYLLNKQEICWLDQYHKFVFEQLIDSLPAEIQPWFAEACSPL